MQELFELEFATLPFGNGKKTEFEKSIDKIGFEANFYKKLNEKTIQCFLCCRYCSIEENCFGKCGVRKNIDGKLYSLVFGKTMTMQLDPIEKKPLFHFKPGTKCFGISTFGCNFFCKFCQNWDLSQQRAEELFEETPFVSPEKIVEKAIESKAQGIAYTYNEPTIFTEYALETMKLAKEKGLYNVWVSNGYMSKECIEAISPYLDAINIDLKGNEKFYQELCGKASIKPVKKSIELFHEKKVHVEVTNLVVPNYNDLKKDFKETAEFIKSIDEFMPLHFTAFHPDYLLRDITPTPVEKLLQAKKIAEEIGLKYVFIGNVLTEENTYCSNCKNLLIERFGYTAEIIGLDKKSNCTKCGKNSKIIL